MPKENGEKQEKRRRTSEKLFTLGLVRKEAIKLMKMKGNEKDCICEKPNGKHRRYCDAFRLSEFLKKCAGFSRIKRSAKIKTKQGKEYENFN